MLHLFNAHIQRNAPEFRLDERVTAAKADRESMEFGHERFQDDDVYASDDVEFVDDAILNTAPRNPIERQLLTGDMIGLALVSGAIIWSAMGAVA
jgi:hypothetical protein